VGTEVTLTFFNVTSKIGLKFSVLAARALEPKVASWWNFAKWRATMYTTFRGTLPHNLVKQKSPKFNAFLRQLSTMRAIISRKVRNVDKRWTALSIITIRPALNKKLVNFCPLTPEITRVMFTHPKLSVRVLRMLIHWSSGNVTLLARKFQLPKMPPNRTYGAGWTHVGLCPKFVALFCFYLCMYNVREKAEAARCRHVGRVNIPHLP